MELVQVRPGFLTGEGEMARLTREYDWSQSVLGPPEEWPQSLQTTLSIILNSRFPMFLFWGPDLICFYNDSYRPSLGLNGKHPSALGSRGVDVWPEIWDIIKPLIDQVLSGGEATWSENQLIPIYRNGKMEDVYWTFSYSPVFDESSAPAGVFVTCKETTTEVLAYRTIEENNRHNIVQAKILHNISDAIIYTDNDFRVVDFNARAEELYGLKKEDVIGKTMSEAVSTLFTDSENGREETIQSLKKYGNWRGEIIQTRADGTPLHILSSVSLVRDDLDETMGRGGRKPGYHLPEAGRKRAEIA
jgi:PAS domain S-box-containing protein